MPCAAVSIEARGGESGPATAAGSSLPLHTSETSLGSHATARDRGHTWLCCFLLRSAGLPHDLDTFTVTFQLERGSQPLATLASLSWNA